MYDTDRDLELMMIGAALARPDLLPKINAASNDLQQLITAMRTRGHGDLKQWLATRGVIYEPGKTLALVQEKVRERWLMQQVERLMNKITKANQVQLPETASKCMDELKTAQGELNEINTRNAQRRSAAAKAVAEKNAARTKALEQKTGQQQTTNRAATATNANKAASQQTPAQRQPGIPAGVHAG